jgi:hypothetical protein
MIPEGLKPIMAIEPQHGAAITGEYINLKNIQELYILVASAGGNALTTAITIEKATGDAAGNIAITEAVPIWSNLDTDTSDLLVRRTDAVSYTTDAGTTHKLIVFKIDPDKLGATYTWLVVKTGASHADNVTCAIYLANLKQKSAVINQATVLT